MISTRDLSLLPDIVLLEALCQSLAMLEAILSPEWESRYYSFNARWNTGAKMVSMRNGSGDEYYLLFTPQGAILKGFAHESNMSPYHVEPPRVWNGVLEDVPEIFAAFLAEPAFMLEDTTFCIWRAKDDDGWKHGVIEFTNDEDPDGSEDLLSILDGSPRTYQAWAEEYYEQPIDIGAVEHIYQHRPLTRTVVTRLNAEMSLQDLEADRVEIGYTASGR